MNFIKNCTERYFCSVCFDALVFFFAETIYVQWELKCGTRSFHSNGRTNWEFPMWNRSWVKLCFPKIDSLTWNFLFTLNCIFNLFFIRFQLILFFFPMRSCVSLVCWWQHRTRTRWENWVFQSASSRSAALKYKCFYTLICVYSVQWRWRN